MFRLHLMSSNSAQNPARVEKMSPMMFKHIVALNTYTEPFLNMKANDQREFIEELLGITELSKKAEVLKEQIKEIEQQRNKTIKKIEQ